MQPGTDFFLKLTVIETYPQLIGYDTQVYEYFREQYAFLSFILALTVKS